MRKCLIEDILHTYTGSREHSSIFQNYYKWVDLVNRRVIKFVKAIPGFKDLNLADQMTLLQGRYIHSYHVVLLQYGKTSYILAAQNKIIVSGHGIYSILGYATVQNHNSVSVNNSQ